MSVKGGGGVPPKSVTFFLAKILSVKGGGGYPPYVVFDLVPNVDYNKDRDDEDFRIISYWGEELAVKISRICSCSRNIL